MLRTRIASKVLMRGRPAPAVLQAPQFVTKDGGTDHERPEDNRGQSPDEILDVQIIEIPPPLNPAIKRKSVSRSRNARLHQFRGNRTEKFQSFLQSEFSSGHNRSARFGYGPNTKSNGDDPTLRITRETVSDGMSTTITFVSLLSDT